MWPTAASRSEGSKLANVQRTREELSTGDSKTCTNIASIECQSGDRLLSMMLKARPSRSFVRSVRQQGPKPAQHPFRILPRVLLSGSTHHPAGQNTEVLHALLGRCRTIVILSSALQDHLPVVGLFRSAPHGSSVAQFWLHRVSEILRKLGQLSAAPSSFTVGSPAAAKRRWRSKRKAKFSEHVLGFRVARLGLSDNPCQCV